MSGGVSDDVVSWWVFERVSDGKLMERLMKISER
jgi:hypothetical protein